MPLDADQIDRFNREVFDLASLSEDERETSRIIAAVLDGFAEQVIAYVEAIPFNPDSRGPGIDEWRVPSAAELRARFDSELRAALSDSVGARASDLTDSAIRRLVDIADVEAPDGNSEFVAAVVSSFLTPAAGDSPADIWAQVHRRLRDQYRSGASVSAAKEEIQELFYGRKDGELSEREADYRERAENSDNPEKIAYYERRASELHAEEAGWVEWRSETIATAIATGAVAASVYSLASENELSGAKTWIHMGDDRVRPQHLAVGGETVDMSANFSNGLRFPGDFNGPISEWANCRCVLFLDGGNLRSENVDSFDELDEGAIFASAGVGAPAEWFDVPSMVEDDTAFVGESNPDGYRRIYGRAWFWDQCLLHGEQERICRTPREFASDDDGYDFFHTLSNFIASDGSRPKPGPMIFGHTGAMTAAQAKERSDNPANVKAVVRIHEDELGATYSGVVLPHVTDEEAAMIPATQVSPEWWRIRPQTPLRLSTLSFVALGALRQNSEALMAAAKGYDLCVTGVEEADILAEAPEVSFEDRVVDALDQIGHRLEGLEGNSEQEVVQETEEAVQEEVEASIENEIADEDQEEVVLERIQHFIDEYIEDKSADVWVKRRFDN